MTQSRYYRDCFSQDRRYPERYCNQASPAQCCTHGLTPHLFTHRPLTYVCVSYAVSFLALFRLLGSNRFHVCYMPRPPHQPRTDHPNGIWWRVQITKLFFMQLSPFLSYFLPLDGNILLSTPFSNTVSLFLHSNLTTDGFWIDDRIYCTLWYTTRDYTLHYTVTHTHTHTHTLVSTVTSSLTLLGGGFQRRTFPFLWVPELSPASATRF
jgi:hypothetical protein